MIANPQLENGYTEIANELIEAICKVNLSAYESRVLWCLIRKTYGWKKKTDRIPQSQIVEMTGISKGHISRTMKSLTKRKIVTCSGNKHIGIQKDYALWKLQKLPNEATNNPAQLQKLPNEATNEKLPIQDKKLPNGVTEVTYPGNKKLPVQEPQKKERNYSKTTIKTNIPKIKYGEFSNVFLTDDEYQKIQDRFGNNTNDLIETLSCGIESKGYKYKSHYATIINWAKRNQEKGGASGNNRQSPRPGAPGYSYADPD